MTGAFFVTYLIPSIAKQDPRYYRMPNASIPQRIGNAIIQPVWARSDKGNHMPNYGMLIGVPAAISLANVYVPGRKRGFWPTADSSIITIASAPIDNLIDEFLPDVAKHVKHTNRDDPGIVNHLTLTEGHPRAEKNPIRSLSILIPSDASLPPKYLELRNRIGRASLMMAGLPEDLFSNPVWHALHTRHAICRQQRTSLPISRRRCPFRSGSRAEPCRAVIELHSLLVPGRIGLDRRDELSQLSRRSYLRRRSSACRWFWRTSVTPPGPNRAGIALTFLRRRVRRWSR